MEGGSSGSAVLMGLLITSPSRPPQHTHTQLTGKVNEGKITHWAKKAPQKVSGQKSTGGLLKVTVHVMTELRQVSFGVPGTPTLSDTPDSGFEAARVDQDRKLRLGDSQFCFPPGHHPRQPGPCFPRLHRVPGGLQSLHLRPQLPRGVCL